jgi:hypothetical protein
MSRIKRRQFLQFAGSTLATLGLSQLDIQTAGDLMPAFSLKVRPGS